MTKKIDRNDNDTVLELPLEALDNVLGGAGAAPIGMGGSLAPGATLPGSQASHGVGYHDHFGLHFGAAAAGDYNGLGFHEAGHDPHASSQATGVAGTHASGPSPVGMGGSLGGPAAPGATATTGDASSLHESTGGAAATAEASTAGSHFEVNATSAFSLVDQGAPQDDAAAAAANHGPAPVGLGGDY